MNTALLPLLTFGAVVAAVAGAYSLLSDLYLRDRREVKRRLDEEFRQRQRDRARQSPLFKDLGQASFDAATEALPTLRTRFETMVEQSGLDLTPYRLLAISISTGAAAGLLIGFMRQSLLLAAIAAPIGFFVPIVYVNQKRKARLERLLSQLPDAFDLMSRVIRAGQTMSQALLAVADEFPQPIAAEFSYCYEQQNLGLPAEAALRDLARRCGLLELKIFVLALIVQQQTGGNLAEMLDKLSNIVRQRYRVRGQIRTLTAEGRLQAVVLLALPIVMFLILLVLNRDYASILLKHPSLITATLVGEGIGALWIRKIVNFDF